MVKFKHLHSVADNEIFSKWGVHNSGWACNAQHGSAHMGNTAPHEISRAINPARLIQSSRARCTVPPRDILHDKSRAFDSSCTRRTFPPGLGGWDKNFYFLARANSNAQGLSINKLRKEDFMKSGKMISHGDVSLEKFVLIQSAAQTNSLISPSNI